MSNITLTILAEDKTQKFHKLSEEFSKVKLQLKEKEDYVEKLEF